MAEPTQAEREHVFREHANHERRSAEYRWFIAAPADAPGRERIPLDLIYESSVDESAGVGVLVNMRQVILEGFADLAANNPELRPQVVAMLETYLADRRTLDRDREVASGVLSRLG